MFDEFVASIWIKLQSFSNQLWPDYIVPNLSAIVFVVILIILAYIIGKIGKFITKKLLSIIGLKRITKKSWAENILKATGYRGNIMELIGDLVKWLIYILFLAVIIQTIGFPGIADFFTAIAIWMPRFIVAILILIVGFIIADFFGRAFEEAGIRFFKDETLGRFSGGLIKYTIAMVIVIIILSLLGLDTVSLVVLLAFVLGTVFLLLILGSKNIIPNISAGIQVKNMVKVGDVIRIGEYKGKVEKIESTNITIVSGKERVIIPNSMLVERPLVKIKK